LGLQSGRNRRFILKVTSVKTLFAKNVNSTFPLIRQRENDDSAY
jgi:hypothetical protein